MSYVKLRELECADLFKIKEWRNRQQNILRQNSELTDEDQIMYWKRLNNSKKEKLYAIIFNNLLIGYCGFVNIDEVNKRAEISFLLSDLIAEGTKKYKQIFFIVLITDYLLKRIVFVKNI